jgi:hypothetical protein
MENISYYAQMLDFKVMEKGGKTTTMWKKQRKVVSEGVEQMNKEDTATRACLAA